MKNATPRISPVFVIVIGIFAVSTASIFIRFAQEYTSSLTIAAYRLTISTMVLAPFAWARYRTDIKSLTHREWWLGGIAGVFLALHFATWITSLEYTSVTSSVVLVTTMPLWVALLAPFALKEPLQRPVVVGLGFALLGGIIVGIGDSCAWVDGRAVCTGADAFFRGETFLGNFLALVGAWTAAGYFLIGRNLRAKLALIPYITLVYGIAALVMIAIVIGFGAPVFGFPPLAYLWLLLLALIPQLLGHSSFNWALGYLPAAFVSITMLGEPIGSIILAYFLLAERPSVLNLLGAGFILFGIYLASRKQK
jgi:drug/metabolite transporter (DMT)-like permease